MKLTINTSDEPTLDEILRRLDNVGITFEDIKAMLTYKWRLCDRKKPVTLKSSIDNDPKQAVSFTLSKAEDSNDDD